MTGEIQIAAERPANPAELQGFYAQAGYSNAPSGADITAFTAREEGRIVGAVLLSAEAGVVVLRSLAVDRTHQRKGLGTRLLQALVERLGERPCYCLTPSRMERVFGKFGFVRVPEAEAPPHLRARWAQYHARDADQVILLRPVGTPAGA